MSARNVSVVRYSPLVGGYKYGGRCPLLLVPVRSLSKFEACVALRPIQVRLLKANPPKLAKTV